jgi:hypothetical protein
MYLARFSYDVLPINRQRAIDFIRREVEAARGKGLNSRMLVPLTRGHGGGAALQFAVELPVPMARIDPCLRREGEALLTSLSCGTASATRCTRFCRSPSSYRISRRDAGCGGCRSAARVAARRERPPGN